MLKYLKVTKHKKLMLRVGSFSVVNWCIYLSYITHDAFRSHTGSIMSLVKGGIISLSLKQKTKVNISTEGELVGDHYETIVVLWSKHFIDYQGYTVEHKNCTKTTILPSLWKIMVEHQAKKEQNT